MAAVTQRAEPAGSAVGKGWEQHPGAGKFSLDSPPGSVGAE